MLTRIKNRLFGLLQDEKGDQTVQQMVIVAIAILLGVATMAFLGINASGESTGGGLLGKLMELASLILPGRKG
jgi:hypothetical protein